MFKAARIAKIKEVILDRGQVDVSTLSSLLNVSDVTIRSDLELLENEKFIFRTYGGAVLNENHVRQKDVRDTVTGAALEYNKNKELIGQIASELIEEAEWVFLGPGTTCYYVAKALVGREHVNVLTNNLYVAGVLSKNRGANVVLTGGHLIHNQMAMGGDMFSEFLEQLYIAKAFLGVDGVDFQSGFTISSPESYNLYALIQRISKQIIIVADSSKFGVTSLMSIGNLDVADSVITNDTVPEEYKAHFFQTGIKIFTSYQIRPSSVQGTE